MPALTMSMSGSSMVMGMMPSASNIGGVLGGTGSMTDSHSNGLSSQVKSAKAAIIAAVVIVVVLSLLAGSFFLVRLKRQALRRKAHVITLGSLKQEDAYVHRLQEEMNGSDSSSGLRMPPMSYDGARPQSIHIKRSTENVHDTYQFLVVVKTPGVCKRTTTEWNGMNKDEPSVFGSPALDEAFCGIGAGIVSTCCMHPLDLLKVKFQVAHRATLSNKSLFGQVYTGLANIVQTDGWKGLYRGITVNLVGNASSWGLYFLWYTMIKERKTGDDPSVRLTAPQHLAASVEAGVYSAMVTNPLWVIKTRMFTTSKDTVGAYRGVIDGLWRISREEGLRGLYKGTTLAMIGISNGAIQFMTYEHLKRWAKDRKRRLRGDTHLVGENDPEPLSSLEYVVLSSSAKLVAIGITYPYQVVRSRMQNQLVLTSHNTHPDHYKSIPDCVRRTFHGEGMRAFYNGLVPNALRVLPGTGVTFLVYEQLSNFLKQRARAQANAVQQSVPS